MEEKRIVELTDNQIVLLRSALNLEITELSKGMRNSEKVLSTLNESDGSIFTETKDDVAYYKTNLDSLESLLHIFLHV